MTKPPAQRLYLALFLICLAANLGFSLVGWNHSLREIHESRQVQTALSARYLQREGWSLDYPLPLFGPPWSAPFEFPAYQYCTALLANVSGLPLESAGRLTALVFFYLALPAIYLLQEFLPIPRERRWLLPSLLLLSPVHLYYSRSFMIESTALCCGAWFLLFFCRALTRPGWIWPAAALLAGVGAALVKLPTLVVFLVPAALFTLGLLFRRKESPAASRTPQSTAARAVLLVIGALLAGILWTRHADAVKASNPLAAAFVSSELRGFVFGPFSQRLAPEFWGKIAGHTFIAVMPVANAVILILFGLILIRPARPVVLGLLLCFLSGPLIFANLHAVHDYYFYACGVFALAALVVAWSHLLDQTQFQAAARVTVILLSLGLQVAAYAASYLPVQLRPTIAPPELAPVLRAVTGADDIVVIIGQDWNPMLAYYADRRAIMVIDRFATEGGRVEEVLQRVDSRRVTALVVTGEARYHPADLRLLITNLGLADRPVLLGSDTHLFVARRLVRAVQDRVEIAPLQGFTLADSGPETVNVPRRRFTLMNVPDPRITSMLHPQPEEIVHPFNLAAYDLDQKTVIDAHAPTDIVFAVPPGARQAEILFGILASAYTGGQPTDGVEFQVLLVPPDFPPRVLFSRILNPVGQVSDRNTQSASVALPAGAAGRLLFRTLPGPGGSITSDWAYWARIDIR